MVSQLIATTNTVLLSNLFVALAAIATSLASSTIIKRDGDSANLVLRPENSLARRTTVNYDQDSVAGGNVIYKASGSYFSVAWSVSSSQDFVVGVGWTTGSSLYEKPGTGPSHENFTDIFAT